MLIFIGLGLYDEMDISLRGLEEIRSSDLLFAEFYTSRLSGTTIEKIEEMAGKKVKVLGRSEVETDDIILKAAAKGKVAFLVAGDPLISTTHITLRLEASERGIETRIVHNASIYSAAPSVTGLFNYKFGRSASIPFSQEGYRPVSYYDAVIENMARGLHTLLFLDIKERLMTVNEALRMLLDIDWEREDHRITEDTLAVGLGVVGAPQPLLKAGPVRELLRYDFGQTPHTLIIPGELHFMEEEYLKAFCRLGE